MDIESTTRIVGGLAAGASISLATFGYSLQIKNTLETGEHMSPTLASFACIASALWCAYGILIHDRYLPKSEGIAVLLTTVIIALKIRSVLINKKKRSKKDKEWYYEI